MMGTPAPKTWILCVQFALERSSATLRFTEYLDFVFKPSLFIQGTVMSMQPRMILIHVEMVFNNKNKKHGRLAKVMTACVLRLQNLEKGTTTFRNPHRTLNCGYLRFFNVIILFGYSWAWCCLFRASVCIALFYPEGILFRPSFSTRWLQQGSWGGNLLGLH